MNENRQYAFYGSLRLGMENYKVFEDGLEFLGKAELRGFKLFSLIDYPYAISTENENDCIVVELFKIINITTEESIHQVEMDAGYIFTNIEIAKQKFGIYLFTEIKDENRWVESGDWVVYKSSHAFES
ncbi:MAG TPA: gamma-glutamylcyclotransferase [Chryseolinea sp.]|nr:gamma-glutamylcyclotransferase [Chryseolinea sp.]